MMSIIMNPFKIRFDDEAIGPGKIPVTPPLALPCQPEEGHSKAQGGCCWGEDESIRRGPAEQYKEELELDLVLLTHNAKDFIDITALKIITSTTEKEGKLNRPQFRMQFPLPFAERRRSCRKGLGKRRLRALFVGHADGIYVRAF